MKIIFYNPPCFHYASSRRFTVCPMLGLPILTAVFNRAGHQAKTVDLEKLKIRPTDLEMPDADWVGFNSTNPVIKGLKECIDRLRKIGYKGRIVVGGNYATLYPEEVLGFGADLVVTGECEGNIIELIESDARGIHAGKPTEIENIPIPDWEHHYPPLNTYDGLFAHIRPNPGVAMWVRGCPFNCIFCGNNVFSGRKPRYRPAKNIIEEMRYLHKNGYKGIYVYDDELFGTKLPDGWLEEIVDGIEELGLNISTQGRCSKKYITPELMSLAKRAGVNSVFWGVESLNDKILKNINKHTTYEDIEHTMRVSHEAGIMNGMMMQIGQYGETPEDAAVTHERLKELYEAGVVDVLRVFVTQILPGTRLEQIAKDEGWYRPPPAGWRHMGKTYYEGTPWMTVNEMHLWRTRYESACPVGDVSK